MIWLFALFTCGLFLAYANGANDNFKGVATLYGSKTASFRTALIWTTLATVAGSVAALWFAHELIIVFKGKGLVPDVVMKMREFPVAVGAGAAVTVMLATILNLPVSTTHALVGALAGAGWVASPTGINIAKLAEKFFTPLIVGPLLSVLLTIALYPLFRKLKESFNIKKQTCLCIGRKVIAPVPAAAANATHAMALLRDEMSIPELRVGEEAHCRAIYSGQVVGIRADKLVDFLHFLSGGLVSFARGLNDTPKIAALLLLGSTASLQWVIAMTGIFILVGGLIHSRRIAETMGNGITEMNAGQGFTANLVTGLMVLGASNVGVPVSTTHVSCGSIFGLGAVTGQARWKVIGQISLAWATTLPLGAVLGGLIMWAIV